MPWIRLRPGATPITAESLREFCTGKLAHYKIPRYVHITDEFPMTVTGKVRKVEMREKWVKTRLPPQYPPAIKRFTLVDISRRGKGTGDVRIEASSPCR